MEARFGDAALTHVEVENARYTSNEGREAIAARFAEIDNARHEFTAGLRERRQSVNVIAPNGTRHEIPDTAWDAGKFPDLLALYKTIPAHAPKPFGTYAGGIIVIATAVLEEWTKVITTTVAEDSADVEAPFKRVTKAELEVAYKERVKNWPKGKPNPRFIDDWNFLRSLSPGFTRDKARAMRKTLSPESWKRDGRRANRD